MGRKKSHESLKYISENNHFALFFPEPVEQQPQKYKMERIRTKQTIVLFRKQTTF